MKRVTFETASLAKQYGFNYPCQMKYYSNGVMYVPYQLFFECHVDNFHKSDESLYKRNSDFVNCGDVACPTQEELKDWFRVVQNILIDIFPVTNGSEWMFEIRTIIKTKDNSTHYEPNDYYKSYEECLEYALKKSFEFCQPIPYLKIEYRYE